MKERLVIFTLICLCTACSVSSGQSIVLEVDKDAYICDCEPNANNPGGPLTKLFQGPYYVSNHKCYARTASYWDLGSIPQGRTIAQVTIEFKCASTYGSLTGEMVFYRFLKEWGESIITSNNVPSYTSQDSIVKDWPVAGQWLSLDATNIVRFWYEHPDSNFGLFGHCVNTTANNGAAAFYSSRQTTSADRPRLTIFYAATDVKSHGALVPSEFRVDAYPNPFNPSTTISYTLDKSGSVSLNIIDMNGRIIENIVRSYQSAGAHHEQWNASRFSSGIYLVALTSGKNLAVKKVALMK